MEKKKYELEDFNDFLLSEDINIVILGLRMACSALDIKSRTLDELILLRYNLDHFHFKFFRYHKDFHTEKGRLFLKINNTIQKGNRWSKAAQENSLKRVKLLLNG